MATDLYTVTLQAESKGVTQTTQEMNKLGTSAGLATKAFRAFAPLIAAAFSARALSGLASQANEFSAAMAEVNTLLSGNSEMPRLTQEAKNLAAQFGGSPTQQAQAFYQAISAGAGNAEQATALLTAANKLAIGGVTDVTTAVDGLTSITNAYGIETSEASRVSDALFVAMRAGKTTVGELSGSIGKVAATAATAGLSFEETLGSISALTTQGIATAEAVTGLKATLSNVLKPSKAASDAAKELGIDFSLAGLQSKGLSGFLDELVTATGGSEEKLLDLFGSTEALNTVFALTGGAAETFGNIMVDMANSAGQTDRAFNKVSNTMSQKLDVLKGKFAVTGIELGNFIVTASTPFVDALNANYDDYIGYFKDLFNATKTTLNALIQLWAPWATKVSKIASVLFKFIADLFTPLIKGATSMLKIFYNIFYGTFKFIATGAETAVRNVVDFFRNGFTIFIPRFIETTKIQIEAFYETMVVKAKSFYETEFNTEKQLAEINKRKSESLAAVTQKYADQQAASVNLADQTNVTTGFFNTLEASVDVVKTTFGEMNTATETLDTSAIDLDSSLAAVNTETAALNTATGTTNTEMTNLATNTRTAAEELAGTDGKGGLTLAQTTFTTAVENTQTAWATLIKDTITQGKLDFGSFFTTVKDGFVTMVAEIAAQNITNAIFGSGGLSGFLSSLTSGFGSIISSIASGLGGVVSQFIANLSGARLGGSAAGAAGGAGIGASVAGAVGAAGQFVSGAMGTAVGTSAALVGPPTAAAAAGAGLSSSAAAFLTNPLTIGIAGAALAAKLLDKGGTPTTTAGLTMAKTGGMSDANIFQTAPFDSNFSPLGFKQNATNEEAEAAIQPFRNLDMTLTQTAKALGYDVNLSGHTFNGYGVEGSGSGTVMGTFIEEGKVKGASTDEQLDRYAAEWIKAVGARNSVGSQVISDIIGDGSYEGILSRSGGVLKQSIDGSHQSGLSSVPYDGYIAELHAGERVQTAAQVAATDRMSSEMVGLRNNLNELMLVVAKAVTKTARIEDRWDKNGLPPVRAQNEGY